jgi:alanine racemase
MSHSISLSGNEQASKSFPCIHIEIDTGMCRLGLNVNEIDEFVCILKQCNSLTVKSVFSHLVASEDPEEDVFTEKQACLFLSSAKQLEHSLGYSFFKHLCNSPAIIRHPHLHFDMIRLGIGLYGLFPGIDLEPVVSLTSSIAQVHHIKKGESVGYNRRTIVNRDSWIGTIRIGFADGVKRQLGNGIGQVWVRDRRVPIMGNICMDMTMIDLTDVTDDNGILNETVEIFGKHISIYEVAKKCNTIPSEILTSIGQRVKRVYTEE